MSGAEERNDWFDYVWSIYLPSHKRAYEVHQAANCFRDRHLSVEREQTMKAFLPQSYRSEWAVAFDDRLEQVWGSLHTPAGFPYTEPLTHSMRRVRRTFAVRISMVPVRLGVYIVKFRGVYLQNLGHARVRHSLRATQLALLKKRSFFDDLHSGS